MEQAQTEEKKKAEGRFSSELFSWGESLMAVLIFFVVVFTFFVRLIGVDGTSMNPTLQDHSIMLVSNLGYTPEKGDIVIVRKEGFWHDQPIVKRVIATGGDTVDIDPVTGDVIVNGEVLDEDVYKRQEYTVAFNIDAAAQRNDRGIYSDCTALGRSRAGSSLCTGNAVAELTGAIEGQLVVAQRRRIVFNRIGCEKRGRVGNRLGGYRLGQQVVARGLLRLRRIGGST